MEDSTMMAIICACFALFFFFCNREEPWIVYKAFMGICAFKVSKDCSTYCLRYSMLMSVL